LKVVLNTINQPSKSKRLQDNNHIAGVIVSMLAPIAVDLGLHPRLGQIQDYKIGICCFSAEHLYYKGIRAKTG
jgi:hypothetical protein